MLCSKCQQPISKWKAIVEDQTYYCRRCRRGDNSKQVWFAVINKPAFWITAIIFFLLAFGFSTIVILVMFGRG